MKHLLLTSLLLGLSALLRAQTPVLHLKMDREGAGQVSDRSAWGNHARLVGGLAFISDRFGNECRALHFDGQSGYLTVPHHRSLNLGNQFTVTAWVRLPNGLEHQGLQWLTLVCKGEQPVENDFSPAFRAQLTSATASVNTASTKTIGSIRQAFPTRRWFHVASVYRGDQLFIYVDGQEAGRYSVSDRIYTNREPLNVGRDIPGNVEHYQGELDDLKLYDQALSAAEVRKIFEDDRDQSLGSACPPPTVVTTDPEPSPPATRGPDLPDFGGMRPRPQPSLPPAKTNPPTQPEPAEPMAPAGVAEPTPIPAPFPDTLPVAPPTAPPVEPEPPISFVGYAPNNLTLVLDVSGSMNYPKKLPLLKEAFLQLLPYMRAEDKISVISYAGGVDVVLEGVPATDHARISRAIENLSSSGTTHGRRAVRRGYRLARQHFLPQGNNRVILATDGSFDLQGLYPLAADMAAEEIVLSVFSFGNSNAVRQQLMDEVARLGQGHHVNIEPGNVQEALLRETQQPLR